MSCCKKISTYIANCNLFPVFKRFRDSIISTHLHYKIQNKRNRFKSKMSIYFHLIYVILLFIFNWIFRLKERWQCHQVLICRLRCIPLSRRCRLPTHHRNLHNLRSPPLSFDLPANKPYANNAQSFPTLFSQIHIHLSIYTLIYINTSVSSHRPYEYKIILYFWHV